MNQPENSLSETNSAHIAPLAVLPVFFKLAGKRVVLAGGSAGAAWKVELLVACGALIDVYAMDICPEMRDLVSGYPGQIRLFDRPWSYDVMQGAALAIGGIETDAEGQAFRCAAKYAGVPVNVVDRPAFCDFSFGAIVNRSPLIIGISTDGAAPVLGQAVRAKIEALLPASFQRWAQAARDWRKAVKASGLSFAARRSFWRRFALHAVGHPNDLPKDSERDRWLVEAGSEELDANGKGRIIFIDDAGGDAEMFTMKAVRMMQMADAIVYDDGLPSSILDLSRREARKIRLAAGVSAADPILELALEGGNVIRISSRNSF